MSVTDELLRHTGHDASTRVIVLAHQTACGTARSHDGSGLLDDVGKGTRREVR